MTDAVWLGDVAAVGVVDSATAAVVVAEEVVTVL